MSDPRFVHLRLHSEYSVVDSILRVDEAIKAAKADAMPALALTDLGNVFGLVKFYSGARKKGLKAIAGCDVWMAPPESTDKPARMLLLVQDRVGWRLLCELLTRAYRTNMNRGRAIVQPAWFDEMGTQGLIALSGGHLGDVGMALVNESLDTARALARAWAERFPDRYYLELQRDGRPECEHHVARASELAAELDLPVVATHPVEFLKRDDHIAHEARVCIAEGYVLADRRRPKTFTEEDYFKSQAEMAELFADIPEALENTLEIARRCNLTLELGKSKLPDFPTPGGMPLDDYLRQRAREGLAERMAMLYPDEKLRTEKYPEYTARLELELDTIIQMGFPGYFLIVADFINWGKNNGVPVGPGRGSGAGSLVAYAIGITDLDPLAYALLFERFLNPERVSMPDFDIDFCQDGRDRVIDYVKRKYGGHAVSQIATFGTMAAKAVIRDVGRVLDLGFNFVDQFAKLIPNELGITLAKAREIEPQINERVEQEEGLRTLWDLAVKLEGLTRNVGMHAGGVLIAPGKLTDFCPLYSADGGITTVSQFDKDDVEKAGLVKFDFLGLRTLTILDEAVRLVAEVEGVHVDLDRLPLDDRETYDLVFKTANTTAVFQFESRGMKDMLVQARPDRLEDLIALNALYRPGPMDLIPSFIARKHGREKVTYLTPTLEKVLANTYGIMVYQEQVMQTAQVVAGYSLGGADLLRRAMGKKKPEEMAKQRQVFVEGAGTKGIQSDTANEIFDYIDKFAGYGFNKSHAAAYSLVAYQTAWLKRHHPAAFVSATLSSEMADTDKVQFFCQDARANGITFLPPDINAGGIRFRPVDAKTVRYGLGAIKGTGEAALSVVMRVRDEAGPFADLFDFCRRVDKRVVNRRVIEALVRAGAFDALDPDRAKLFASVGVALEAAEQAERNQMQGGLFDMGGGSGTTEAESHYVRVQSWGERERLQQEKQALGFFFSGHPFTAYGREVASFVRRRLAQLEPQKEPALLAGVVLSTRTQMTRRGKMAVVMLDDASAQVEVSVFNELWEAERAKIKEDEFLLVEGKVSRDDYSGGMRVTADRLYTLAEARGRYARMLRLSMNGGSDAGAAQRLKSLLHPYRQGGCQVRVAYRNREAEAEIVLPEEWRLRLDDALLASLSEWLSPENVQVVYI